MEPNHYHLGKAFSHVLWDFCLTHFLFTPGSYLSPLQILMNVSLDVCVYLKFYDVILSLLTFIYVYNKIVAYGTYFSPFFYSALCF